MSSNLITIAFLFVFDLAGTLVFSGSAWPDIIIHYLEIIIYNIIYLSSVLLPINAMQVPSTSRSKKPFASADPKNPVSGKYCVRK